MKRWTTMMLMVVGLAWTTGCASGDKKKDDSAPMAAAVPVEQAIVGSWSKAGGESVAFAGDGTYVWESVTSCGNPPCPKRSTSGSWKVQHGNKLYLTPSGGDLAIHDVSVSGSSLELKDPKGDVHSFSK